jgi:hypothetical protein
LRARYGLFFENSYLNWRPVLYHTDWEKSSFAEISIEKELSIKSAALNPGTYEYRAVAVHPGMRIYGDNRPVKNEK